MAWGLVAALIACVGYGIASVLQALGARTVESTQGVDPRLMVRVMRSLPFVGGLALDAGSLVFNLIALRSLPLFTVQAVVNTNLAVTALASVVLLHVRLKRRDVAAIGAVIGGLVLLGVSSGHEGSGHFTEAQRWGLFVVAVVLSGAALAIGNLYKSAHPALLGGLAGILFGVFGIGVRVLPTFALPQLLGDPATYAALVASVTAFLFFTTALQRGSVTAATAALVVGETALPALVGVLMLGDAARPGFAPVGVAGFLLAVGGALALSRFGEVQAEPEGAAAPGAEPSESAESAESTD